MCDRNTSGEKKKKKQPALSLLLEYKFLLLGVMANIVCGSWNVMWWPAKFQCPSEKINKFWHVFLVVVFRRNLLVNHVFVVCCWWLMYPTGLGFFGENRSSDHCIRLALAFFSENQSQDCCIRPTLDSPARTDQVIVTSDRPWCFSARTDQMIVQVSDEFWPVLKFYLIILLFVLCAPSYSNLRGSIKICFSSCFSFACTFQAGFIWCICSSLRGSVRRDIRVLSH
jgi:hypothetical protein